MRHVFNKYYKRRIEINKDFVNTILPIYIYEGDIPLSHLYNYFIFKHRNKLSCQDEEILQYSPYTNLFYFLSEEYYGKSASNVFDVVLYLAKVGFTQEEIENIFKICNELRYGYLIKSRRIDNL